MKRATDTRCGFLLLEIDFNPRPREEGDVPATRSAEMSGNFNPRPREEGDYGDGKVSAGLGDFNPRPREEGDGWR